VPAIPGNAACLDRWPEDALGEFVHVHRFASTRVEDHPDCWVAHGCLVLTKYLGTRLWCIHDALPDRAIHPKLFADDYVLFSWVYDAFNELPYLRLRGDAGSGKTRFLLIVGSLCYKPIFASGASTVSPLFRILDSMRGTLIVDEGDFRFSDEKAELVKILNNGNGRGFPVLRSESVSGKEF